LNTVVKRPIPVSVAFALALASVIGFVMVISLLFGGDSGRRRSSPRTTCINVLRTIDSAKEQWALETKAVPGAVVSESALLRYMKPPFPTCPRGGVIKIQPFGVYPVCSYPGHVVPESITVETNGAFPPGR
jgi:hypothetical protein